jgi:hypothetical protein
VVSAASSQSNCYYTEDSGVPSSAGNAANQTTPGVKFFTPWFLRLQEIRAIRDRPAAAVFCRHRVSPSTP